TVLADCDVADRDEGGAVQRIARSDHTRHGAVGTHPIERISSAAVDGKQDCAVIIDAEIRVEAISGSKTRQFSSARNGKRRLDGSVSDKHAGLSHRTAEILIIRAEQDRTAVVEAEAREVEIVQIVDATGGGAVEEQHVRDSVRSAEHQAAAGGRGAACGY